MKRYLSADSRRIRFTPVSTVGHLRSSVTSWGRRGFSLIEMLVVMALMAILMTLVLQPLVTTFNFTNRAKRSVEVQDAARYAMEVMSREIADAMHVVVADGDSEPFYYYPGGTPGEGQAVVVRGQGFINVYDNAGAKWDLPMAMLDIVLPHDSLGLEGGGVLQPLVAQHQTVNGAQHPMIVRYFIGLTRPEPLKAGSPPFWWNNMIGRQNRPQNLYTLYRAEFDPYDPRFSRWALPDPAGATTPDGRSIWYLNPDFFYDQTVVDGESQSHWWRKRAVAIMPTDSMDLVDFVRSNPKALWNATTNPYLEARSLVSFNPLIMSADSAAAVGADREPGTYKTQYGHWDGLQNDGTVPYTGFQPVPGARYLPHIVVYHQRRDDQNNSTLEPVFDTAKAGSNDPDDPAKKNRVLAWNSQKGTVEFSLSAPVFDTDSSGKGSVITSMYDPLNQTTGFTPPPGAYITPATEVVTVSEDNGPVVYSRSSSDMKDVFDVPDDIALQNGAPKQLPPPRTYMVTNSGKVIVGYPYPSEYNPIQSQPVPKGHRVTISYYYQNNAPDDLVKVDYLTRELVNISLTARTYDPVTRGAVSTTVVNRVRIRNTQR